MDNSKWEKALSACDELDKLIEEASPMADPPRLACICSIAGQLKTTGDGYILMKAGQLESRAEMLLSARRHLDYPGGGAEALQRELRYSLLGSIREQLRLRAQQG